MSDAPRMIVFAGEADPAVARAVRRAVEQGATAVTEAYDADLALCLDRGALAAAREAGVPYCCAVAPDTVMAQAEAVSSADLVLVAHGAIARQLERHGTPAERIATVGPIAPRAYSPAQDRDALAREAGIAPERAVALVPAAMVEEHGVHALLVQLGLTALPVTWSFDVGRDAKLAEVLRREAPVHDLDAVMFAADRDRAERWSMAHAVLARPDGPETSCALGVGAALVLVGGDSLEAGALGGEGVARRAEAVSSLAVTLDAALAPDALERARRAARGLDASGSAGRAVTEAAAWRARAEAESRGLPAGLERLGEARGGGGEPAEPAQGDEDVDSRIEQELAELKKRLD